MYLNLSIYKLMARMLYFLLYKEDILNNDKI